MEDDKFKWTYLNLMTFKILIIYVISFFYCLNARCQIVENTEKKGYLISIKTFLGTYSGNGLFFIESTNLKSIPFSNSLNVVDASADSLDRYFCCEYGDLELGLQRYLEGHRSDVTLNNSNQEDILFVLNRAPAYSFFKSFNRLKKQYYEVKIWLVNSNYCFCKTQGMPLVDMLFIKKKVILFNSIEPLVFRDKDLSPFKYLKKKIIRLIKQGTLR